MAYIDLHTHSTASDGSFSPGALVRQAKESDLAALALTDHDTLKGLEEAEEEAGKDLEFVRGCEVSVTTPMGSMHILGLWLPRDCAPLEDFLASQRERRNARNMRMIEKLNALGLKISMEDLMAHADSSAGRLHMAKALLDKGYVKNLNDAFSEYLGDNAAAYVPKPFLDPAIAISIMHKLGATVAVAHPLLEKPDLNVLDSLIAAWKNAGLGALEAWHSIHNPEQTETVIELAKKHGLGLSGGSDFHGAAKPHVHLGKVWGNRRVPISVLENLKERRKKAGLPC